MTKEDADFWVEDEFHYPVTIIADRYSGVYSRAKFTAWPHYETGIPDGPSDGDTECSEFWDSYSEPVGKGKDPNEAFQDLIDKMDVLASS